MRRKVLQKMLYKKVSLIACGKTVSGIPMELKEDKNAFYMTIEHEPVKWHGSNHFRGMFWERKEDGHGQLKHVKLLDNGRTATRG